MITTDQPILEARGLTRLHDGVRGCYRVDLEVYPSEVLAIVGESGSGKTTLLDCLSGRTRPDAGELWFDTRRGDRIGLWDITEGERRALFRTDLGYVHQNPRDGLRIGASAGANIGEPLMAVGARHYGRIRDAAIDWMSRVELDTGRIDDLPSRFSGGMQQRLQIARNLVVHPRLVFMDEPTSGLDVSVQAKLLDLLRRLAGEIGIAIVIVTHDLAVARLLSQRIMVMQLGRVVESGLTDQVLDDPQHAYTQLLVSSALQ